MQYIVALLAVLFGVAFATPVVISSDDVDQKNRDISATEYLKRIFQDSVMHYDIRTDVSSMDDLPDILVDLGLHQASDIARRVNLEQIIRDYGYPLTMYLPSDEAVQKWNTEFSDMGLGLRPETLRQLVKAWIIPGYISSFSINNDKLLTLNGASLRYNIYNKTIITVNGARVTKSHRIGDTMLNIVDKVIYPLPAGDTVQTLGDVPEVFSVIVHLLKQAGLSEQLAATDPITVLAPTNQAFQALPAGVVTDLARNVTKLKDLLKYHVISDIKYSASFASGKRITAMQGDEISVTKDVRGGVRLNQERDGSGSRVIVADIPTTNGVIHVIDRVLIPSQKHYVLA